MPISSFTGMVRDTKCFCGTAIQQKQNYIVPPGIKHWQSPSHEAPCGLPCFGGPISGEALQVNFPAGEIHRRLGCPRCGAAGPKTRGPRSRVKSIVTASPILGWLTVNEVRVIEYMIRRRIHEGGHWVISPLVASQLKMPESTVRGTLRRLAARGMTRQDSASSAWQINLPKSVTNAELIGSDR